MFRLFILGVAFAIEIIFLKPSILFAQASVSLSTTPGLYWDASSPPPAATSQPSDWLTDVNPLFVTPSQIASSTITIDPTGFPPAPNYSGKLDLSLSCCGIVGAPGSVSPGVNADFGVVGSLGSVLSTEKALGLGGSSRIAIQPKFVDVAGSPVQKNFVLTANSAALFNTSWTVQLRAQDTSQGVDKSINILFTILPDWPPDGPAPTCTPGLYVLPWSQMNVYSWKLKDLSRTTWPIALGLKTDPATPTSTTAGLIVTLHKPSVSLPPNMALVTFKHNTGWHVGIRNDNSKNCTTSGTTRVVEAGETTGPFLISTADTTTLVFSRPVCRAFFVWCWGKVGLDDFFEFSEGPFWILFGGHQVDIETVGDWGHGIQGGGVASSLPSDPPPP